MMNRDDIDPNISREYSGATLPSGLKIPNDGEWVVVRNFIIRTNNKDKIDSNLL